MSARGKWLFDVTDEEMEEAKRKYARHVPPSLMAYVEQMSEFDQELFWRNVAANMDDCIDREFLRRLCDLHKPAKDVPDDLMSATPFRDAETSLSSGNWFGNGVARRL